MTSMRDTIIPKSDQANYDDFVGGVTKTIKITKVTLVTGDQPASLHYEGDNGKPFKPCKSMCRVLVKLWGDDASKYIGRSLTLYGDENVVFAGAKVGGIRISHMSDIKEPVTLALTVTKARRNPFTVKPLLVEEGSMTSAMPPPPDPALADWISDIHVAPSLDHLKLKHDAAWRLFKNEESRARIIAAKEKRKAELTNQGEDDAGISRG